MKPFKIEIVTDGGPWVEHNYPCPIYNNLKAVYNMDKGIFEPSWVAQDRGYFLVYANNWFKKLLIEWFFK